MISLIGVQHWEILTWTLSLLKPHYRAGGESPNRREILTAFMFGRLRWPTVHALSLQCARNASQSGWNREIRLVHWSLEMQRLLCRSIPRRFRTRQQVLCAVIRLYAAFSFLGQTPGQCMSGFLCTGDQICIRIGICSCLYAWKSYHKWLQGWSRWSHQAYSVRTYSLGTAGENRRRSTALAITEISRRLPPTVGSSSFRPCADRWAIRCISYIIMGLRASLESVRSSEIKEANGAMIAAVPCHAW